MQQNRLDDSLKLIQMKNRKNSKQLGKKSMSCTMLLQKKPRSSVGYIPLRLNMQLEALDVSHQNISSLQGIDVYKKLKGINLAGNQIGRVEDLKPLQKCADLREVWIRENPLCEKINYPMHVAELLPQVQIIDDIFLGENSYENLMSLEQEIGHRISIFLFQKCRIGAQLLSSHRDTNWEFLEEELDELVSALDGEGKTLMDMNWELKALLPLSTICSPTLSSEDVEQVQDYLLDSILILSALQQPPHFINKILDKVEVADEQEQNIISNQPLVARSILKSQILNDYEKRSAYSSKRHFTSAETALDSNDRIISKSHSVHFLLDSHYIFTLRSFLKQQCLFIKNQIHHFKQQRQVQQFLDAESKGLPSDGRMMNDSHSDLEGERNKIMNDDDYFGRRDEQIASHNERQKDLNKQFTFNRFSHKIYQNPIVLGRLVQNLERSIKKIIFSTLFSFQSRASFEQVWGRLQDTLVRREKMMGFENMKKEGEVSELMQEMVRKRLRRILRAWANVKKRKQALMKKILLRKLKEDSFVRAIYLTKWKMTARARGLRKMASDIVLKKPSLSLEPQTRKQVEAAYKGIKQRNCMKALLRIKS